MAFVDVPWDAVGSVDNWSLEAGTDKMSATALPDDDALSYIAGDTALKRQTFKIPIPAVGAFDGTMQIYVRACSDVNVAAQPNSIIGCTQGGVDSAATHNFTASVTMFDWTDGTIDMTADRPGGGAWTDADLLDPTLEFYVEVVNVDPGSKHCVTTLQLQLGGDELPPDFDGESFGGQVATGDRRLVSPCAGNFTIVPNDPHGRLSEWHGLLNGNLSLGCGGDRQRSGHIDGQWLDVTVPTTGVGFTWPHDLRRTPVGFVVFNTEVEQPLIKGLDVPHTAAALSLFSNAADGSHYLILVI